jgi:drug/metabolite transporter (DMT)-like permease
MSRLSANLILALTALIWGGGFIAQRTGMAELGPFWFTSLRFLVAFVVMLPLGLREARQATRKLRRRDFALLLPLAGIFFAASALQQVALLYASVTDVGFLTGLYVLFVPALAVILFRERLEPAIWPAAIIAVVGTWLLSGGVARFGLGQFLTIVASIGYAMQIVLLGQSLRTTGRPALAAMVQSLACAVLGAACAILLEPISVARIAAAAPSLLYAGAFSAGVAFFLQAVGQQYAPAADAAIVLTMEAPFAALLAALLLGERLDAAGWTGCALIFASFLVVQLAPLLRRRVPAAT